MNMRRMAVVCIASAVLVVGVVASAEKTGQWKGLSSNLCLI